MDTNITTKISTNKAEAQRLNIRDFGYRIIQLEINNTCNMRCTFCPLPIRKMPFNNMNTDDVLSLLDNLKEYEGIDYVAFHQFSEPLLNKDIWRYINKCNEIGLRSHLVTNGLLLTEENIEKLYKYPPDTLRISLQIIDPEKYQEIRGVKSNPSYYYNQIAACLGRFFDEPPKIAEIRTDIAVNDDRYAGLSGLKKYIGQKLSLFDSGDPTIYNQTAHSIKPYLIKFLRLIEENSNKFSFSEPRFNEYLEKFYNSSNCNENFSIAYELNPNNFITYKIFINGRKISKFYPVQRGICRSEIIGILTNGTVTLCCNDYDGFTGLGNIFQEELISIIRRNKHIIEGINKTGNLYFDTCKSCLGSNSKLGSILKNQYENLKYLHRKFFMSPERISLL